MTRTQGNEKVLLVPKLPGKDLFSRCFELQKTQATRIGEGIPPPPTPDPAGFAHLLRDQVDLGGILLGKKGESDVRGAMIGSLCLILSCQVENLRGRAIFEVKSSLPSNKKNGYSKGWFGWSFIVGKVSSKDTFIQTLLKSYPLCSYSSPLLSLYLNLM